MKNILFRLALVASSLFLSSCSKPSDLEKKSFISSSSQAEPSYSHSTSHHPHYLRSHKLLRPWQLGQWRSICRFQHRLRIPLLWTIHLYPLRITMVWNCHGTQGSIPLHQRGMGSWRTSATHLQWMACIPTLCRVGAPKQLQSHHGRNLYRTRYCMASVVRYFWHPRESITRLEWITETTGTCPVKSPQ